MNNLLYATTNKGKLAEAVNLLSDLPVKLFSLKDFDQKFQTNLSQEDVAETGETFQENALLKARFFAKKAKMLTVAEDAGLQVKALNGEPGVKSARWYPGTDADRNKALLDRLKGIDNRQAIFVTVVCLFLPSGEYYFFQGKMPGQIALQAKGENGFGYDPIFIPEGYEQTFAQLGTEIKNAISHRKRALVKLKDFY